MVIDRRQILAGLLAGLSVGASARAEVMRQRLYVSCRMDAADNASIACLDAGGHEVFATSLPARGHDATARPHSPDFVVFARRPGNWFAVIDGRGGRSLEVVHAPDGRHFYGHGVFSVDGRLLYVTENDIATGDGAVGVHDATDGFRRIADFPSGGVGPHDISLMPDGHRLVIANGGLRTHPDTGRETLNPGDMRPNLVLADMRHGEVLARHELEPGLRQLSIRHLAVRGDGTVAFGCQYEGDPQDAPPLIGLIDAEGRIDLPEMDEATLFRMQNYVGSVAFDDDGRSLIATSPKGGAALVWDMERRRVSDGIILPDVCGATALPRGGFLLSSGHGQIAAVHEPGTITELRRSRWIWDNHIAELAPLAA